MSSTKLRGKAIPLSSRLRGEGVSRWPQAVVFDLDGTLVDTAADIAVALNQTLHELGLPPHPEETVRSMIGGGLAKLLDRALSAHSVRFADGPKDRAAARLLEIYAAKPAALSRLYPGVREALDLLHQADIPCGLCTNKQEAISRDVLRALGIVEAFAVFQCGDSDLPRKPDPAGLLGVIEALGAEPATALMVGDNIVDVEAARAAGLRGVILVSYGYSVTPVTELGADMVINGLSELPEALARFAPGLEHEI